MNRFVLAWVFLAAWPLVGCPGPMAPAPPVIGGVVGGGGAGPTPIGGKRIFELHCKSCHFAGGEGAPVAGLWGTTIDLATGDRVVVDEQFLRRAILQPDSVRRLGPPKSVAMPSFAGMLQDTDLQSVIAYYAANRSAQ